MDIFGVVTDMTTPKWNRLRLKEDITYRLRNLKGRTSLTPNLSCRLGFCLSLADPRIPDPSRDDENGMELNRSTLLGDWDDFYEILLRERILQDGLDLEKDFLPQLRAHMNRGAEMACNRIKNLSDVLALVPNQKRAQ